VDNQRYIRITSSLKYALEKFLHLILPANKRRYTRCVVFTGVNLVTKERSRTRGNSEKHKLFISDIGHIGVGCIWEPSLFNYFVLEIGKAGHIWIV
jgi:hypothetical protein